MNATQEKLSPQAKALAIVGVSAALGWLFDALLNGKALGIGLPLFVSCILTGLTVLSLRIRKTVDTQAAWLFIPLVAFGIMVAVRASFFLTFLNLIACVVLLLLIAATVFRQQLMQFRIGEYVQTAFLPFRWVVPFLQTVAELATVRSSDRHRESLQRVVRGAVLTIPVLIVFALLLSSADLVFGRYLSNLITIQPETLARIVQSTIVAMLFIGAYAYIFRPSQQKTEMAPEHLRLLSLGSIESSMLLGSLVALFAVFILVQFAYLFGGEQTILAQGFTYADYARRGFFELVGVAALALALLVTVEAFVAKLDASHTRTFKLLSTTLVVEVLLIMGSAAKRLALYEGAYGFSVARLYSHVFIFFLAAIFVLLLYKIHQDAREEVFAFRSFAAALLFLGIMNGINPDAFIARQNISRYATTQQLDVSYLAQLSDDALPETIKVLDLQDEQLRGIFASTLYWNNASRFETNHEPWQSLNLSRSRANELLQSNKLELEQYQDFVSPETIIPEVLVHPFSS
ncbi:MAG: DUF4173 domain-containing protein [Patescibacteria group bacterium]